MHSLKLKKIFYFILLPFLTLTIQAKAQGYVKNIISNMSSKDDAPIIESSNNETQVALLNTLKNIKPNMSSKEDAPKITSSNDETQVALLNTLKNIKPNMSSKEDAPKIKSSNGETQVALLNTLKNIKPNMSSKEDAPKITSSNDETQVALLNTLKNITPNMSSKKDDAPKITSSNGKTQFSLLNTLRNIKPNMSSKEDAPKITSSNGKTQFSLLNTLKNIKPNMSSKEDAPKITSSNDETQVALLNTLKNIKPNMSLKVNTDNAPTIKGSNDVFNPKLSKFSYNGKKITGFSSTIGSRVLFSNNVFYGVELTATYFKGKNAKLGYIFDLPAGTTLINDKDGNNNYSLEPFQGGISFDNKTNAVTINPKALYLSANNPAFKTAKNLKESFTMTYDLKRKYAVNADVMIGKRFYVLDNLNFDVYAILGYGVNSFQINNQQISANSYDNKGNIVSQDSSKNIQLANLVKYNPQGIKASNVKGFRYGLGVTFNLNKKIGVFSKITKQRLIGNDYLGNKLANKQVDIGIEYRF